jgi:integrase
MGPTRTGAKPAKKPTRKSAKRGFGALEVLPSRRIRARYTGPDGAFHSAPRTFDTRLDAEAWLTDERRLISAGTWTSPTDRAAAAKSKPVTFGQYAEAWLTGRKVRGRALADRTRDSYRDLLGAYILPTFATVPLKAITPEMVDHWYELCAVGRPTTQARAYSLLRTILGTAVDRNLISTANPAKVRGGGSAERAKKVRPATLAELETLTAAMPDKHLLLVMLASWCALRFGEIAELRRKDIDLKTGVVRVRRGVIRTRTTDDDGLPRMVAVVKTPKSDAGVRDVAIPPHLIPMVRDHLKQHAAPGPDGLLFPGADGGHLAPSSLYGRVATTTPNGGTRGGWGFYQARHIAGRDDLRFHDLRHTGAVLAAQTGATLAELMGRLGHSTPQAALRYQHAAAERDHEIARRLSLMVGENPA